MAGQAVLPFPLAPRDVNSGADGTENERGETMGWLADETGLDKQPANHLPLTPLSHLIGPWPSTPANGACVRANPPDLRRVSRALHPAGRSAAARGIKPGDVVATILPNLPAGRSPLGRASLWCRAQHDQHAPRSGDGAHIFEHGGAKIVLCDTAFRPCRRGHRRDGWPRPRNHRSARPDCRFGSERRATPPAMTVACGRRPGFCLDMAGGRMGVAVAELHLRHHGQRGFTTTVAPR